MSEKKRSPRSPKAKTKRGPSIELDKDTALVLIQIASLAREQAYAPYSGYPVGAALLAADGSVFAGCNIENASFGLTNCAERVAIGKAVSEGVREYLAIAVVTEDGGTPCGACRQVMHEFATSRDLAVIIADAKGKYHVTSSDALLPGAFRLRA